MNVWPRLGLERVLDEIGTALFELVHGDPNLVDDIGGVAIHDPLDQAVLPRNALVLGVGLHEATEIARELTELGRQGAAVLVVRSPVPSDTAVITAAERSGVAVVGLTHGASWIQAAALLRSLLEFGGDATEMARRLHADLLSNALGGGSGAADAMRRLRLDGCPVVVCALAISHPADAVTTAVTTVTTAVTTVNAEARLMMERQKLSDAFARHLKAVHPRSVAGLLGDVAYGLVPIDGAGDRAGQARADGEERALRIAEDFLARLGGRARAVIGVGPVALGPNELTRARACADRVVQVLCSWHGEGSRAARLADVHGAALVHEMRDRAAGWGDRPTGPLARLLAYDERHDSQLVATLRAWLEAFGDVNAAAAAVYVHPSTFRYRLRRLVEIGGLDLADPEARFTAQLQLRVVDGLARNAASAGS
jgi:hypothetical protein